MTKIPTYGRKVLDIDLGRCQTFQWSFVIVCVNIPIIAADFLINYVILKDVKNKTFIPKLHYKQEEIDWYTLSLISENSHLHKILIIPEFSKSSSKF